MQVRHAIAAVTVAAFALTLSACSSDPEPTTATGDPTAPAPTASATPTATAAPTPTGEIRPLQPGFDLEGVSDTLRSGFPSYAEKTNDEIVVILNAGCDGIDAKGTPQAGADAIQGFGIDVYDAAFSITASIQLYCPEYKAFLRGDGTSNG